MPWLCCAETLTDSTAACPKCGASKRSWTVRLKNTKRLVVGKAEWQLDLLDAEPLDAPPPPDPADDWDLLEVEGTPVATPQPEPDDDWDLLGAEAAPVELASKAGDGPDDWELLDVEATPVDLEGREPNAADDWDVAAFDVGGVGDAAAGPRAKGEADDDDWNLATLASD